MNRLTVFLGAIAVLLSAATLCASADEYSYQRTLDTQTASAGARAVDVTGYNGNIHLYADGGNAVKVHAVLKARSDEALRELNVKVAREGNTVVVQDVCPQDRGVLFWHFKDCDIELDVHYPAGVALSVESQNGNVVGQLSAGPLNLKNSNGNVTIDGTGEGATIANTNGNVRIGTAFSNVKITNTNGNVSVALAKSWHGDAIELHTNAGNVHLSVPANFGATYRTKTTLGNVENGASIRNGRATVTATTTFGNVIISQQ